MADGKRTLEETIRRHKTISRMDSSQKAEHGLSIVEDIENSREFVHELKEEIMRMQERVNKMEKLLAQLRCVVSVETWEMISSHGASLGKGKEGEGDLSPS
ncbi:hypothetical protein K445DRAFT_8384 [Daldinia sp. EC12]|nr:hypothetical protein F4774DRAFT_410176 [Daldinia eschscholtzii]OTB19335.1 hypothetical protein K445DRAFT_8384 [Daldinia sp. EC12]